MPAISESSSFTKDSAMPGIGQNPYIFYSLFTIPLIVLALLTTSKYLKKKYYSQDRHYLLKNNYTHAAVIAKSGNLAARMSSTTSALPEKVQMGKQDQEQHQDYSKSTPMPFKNHDLAMDELHILQVVAKTHRGKGNEEDLEQQQQSQDLHLQENRPHSAPLEKSIQMGRGAGSGALEFDFDLARSRNPRPPQNDHATHPALDFKPKPVTQDITAGVASATKPGMDKLANRSSSSSSSLIYPEPPSPTIISLAPLRIQTQQPQDRTVPLYLQNQPRLPQHPIQFVPSPTEYTSFEAMYSQNPPYHSETEDDTSFAPSSSQDAVPRRRSYTKALSDGSEMSGEIVVSSSTAVEGQQWRRHTRVFGGGVCKACEESESQMRRLSA